MRIDIRYAISALIIVCLLSLYLGSKSVYKKYTRKNMNALESIAWQVFTAPNTIKDLLQPEEKPSEFNATQSIRISEPQKKLRLGQDTIPFKKALLYSYYDQDNDKYVIVKRRMDNNTVLHQWELDYDKASSVYEEWLSENRKEYPFADYFLEPMPLFKSSVVCPILLEGERVAFFLGHWLSNTPIYCLNRDSELLWISKHLSHHMIEKDHQGNLWYCSWSPKSENRKKHKGFANDMIVQVDQEGKTLYKMKVSEILNKIDPNIRFSNHYWWDPYHLNDIQPVLEDSKMGVLEKRGLVFKPSEFTLCAAI